MRKLPVTIGLLMMAACSSPGKDADNPLPTVGPAVETRPPNGVGQQPAFPGQTRAPFRSVHVSFEVQTIAQGLEYPWAIEVLEDGRMLVTERPGRLRIVMPNGMLSEAVSSLPPVDARGQGGLLDVAVDPSFSSNQTIYWSYAEPRMGGNGTALAKGRLVTNDGSPRIDGVQVLFHQLPTLNSTLHFGSRIAFSPDGMLYLTLGERSILAGRVQAQDLGSHLGKVIRINRDGSVPADNPVVGQSGALPEVWSYGHRNAQSAAIHPDTGALWTVEHGAQGGDELNALEPGKNYGWPIITYGVEYNGSPIGEGLTAKSGMEQPLYYWDPVIAPSGMLFYTGNLFPAWKGSLFIGALQGKHLVRLTLEGKLVVGEERLLEGLGKRIRDVVQGPDGAVYLVTDESVASVLKLVPKSG